MIDITEIVSAIGYIDKSSPSEIPNREISVEKLMDGCFLYNYVAGEESKIFIGRVEKISSSGLEPKVDVVLKNQEGEQQTLNGVLYGGYQSLKVYVQDLRNVVFEDTDLGGVK